MDDFWTQAVNALKAEIAPLGDDFIRSASMEEIEQHAPKFAKSSPNTKASILATARAIASSLVQQEADFHEYTDGFKVTEAEFEIIKSMGTAPQQ